MGSANPIPRLSTITAPVVRAVFFMKSRRVIPFRAGSVNFTVVDCCFLKGLIAQGKSVLATAGGGWQAFSQKSDRLVAESSRYHHPKIRSPMSWTDVFPVLTDEQVIEFQEKADPGEMAELEEWFGVARTINGRETRNVVAASLFWKNCNPWQPELPPITRDLMLNAVELGLVSRYAPWDHYVQPLLDGAAIMANERPDVVFRVYLAADLDFLIPDLVEAGCEVKLMKSSSIRHNPGAMWRFLAFEEAGQWVTITDSDLARDILGSVERTELGMKADLGSVLQHYSDG